MNSHPIFWITPKLPFPPEDGARVATSILLKEITTLGRSVHLISFVDPEEIAFEKEAKEQLGVNSLFLIPKASKEGWKKYSQIFRSFLFNPFLPLTMREFGTSRARATLKNLILQHPQAIIVYDGLHPAAHRAKKALYLPLTNPVIYRAHNRESELWERKALQLRGKPTSPFFSLQAKLVQRFEESLIEASAVTVPVSVRDQDLFQQRNPKAPIRVVHIGQDFSSFPSAPKDPFSIFFLGRLDWPPNREGLSWFLKTVWKKALLQRPELQLFIAGSGDGSWLRSFESYPRVTFLGRVNEVSSLYDRCGLSLVPIFFGSGTRVKVIEACRYGRPVLSTSLGVEGCELRAGKEFFHGETSQDWIQTLVKYSSDEALMIGEHAYRRGKEIFDQKACAVRMTEIMDEFTHKQL